VRAPNKKPIKSPAKNIILSPSSIHNT
jgi:hypothetical protein